MCEHTHTHSGNFEAIKAQLQIHSPHSADCRAGPRLYISVLQTIFLFGSADKKKKD